MTDCFPRRLSPWTIQAHRDQLHGIAGSLPPGTEMRLLSVLRAAKFEVVWVNRGSGLLEFNADDFDHVAEALGV